MKEWYLSADLIGMDTMPKTLTGVSQKARRENWKSRKAAGGGRSLEFHISNFNDDIIQQLQKKFLFTNAELAEAIPLSGTDRPFSKKMSISTNQTIKKKDDMSSTNYLYNFLGKLIGYPIETIETWASEDKLTEKLDRKLLDMELQQQELKRYKEDVWWPDDTDTESTITDDSYFELDYYDVDTEYNQLTLQKNKNTNIIFSHDFINNEMNLDKENIFLMPAHGDSMSPTLKNKAIIMVNKIEQFTSDGVYVFKFCNQIMVKRLQFTKTGLNVVSDNPSYKLWEITSDELTTKDFEMIGEVIWTGQGI